MRPVKSLIAVAVVIAAASSVHPPVKAQQSANWMPQWTEKNAIKLPMGYREWLYLGSPTTPNGLNDGKANFPEFHNVYVPKEVFDAFKSTGTYPEGSIFVKELQLAMPGTYPDGSRDETSGRGYFPGAFNGMDVMVKDSKRCAGTSNWCFFNFGHHAAPYEPVAAIMPEEKCAGCHEANADKDLHFTQFYQLLQPAAQ
jgi:Cytochrome P460